MTSVVPWTLIRAGFRLRDYAVFRLRKKCLELHRECTDDGLFPLREIHRASECALQGLLRPIGSRGEAKLM